MTSRPGAVGQVGIVAMLVVMVTTTGCFENNGSSTSELRIDVVHEWGVFVQEYGGNDTLLTGGPQPGHPEMPIVEMDDKKPVIYFYGRGFGEARVTVTTNATDIVTIPQATVADGTINWQVELMVGDGNYQAVVVNGEETWDYLFYEGRETVRQEVAAHVVRDDGNLTFNVTNLAAQELGDVLFWYLPEEGLPVVWNVSTLPAGETVVNATHLSRNTTVEALRMTLEGRLRDRGLWINEIDDLLEYWVDGETDAMGLQADDTFFEGNGTAHLLYCLSPEGYDTLLPLAIDPTPGDVVRVGLVWVQDIPIVNA